MEDLLCVEDEYEYYTESEVEADGEEEEDDDDETIKNVPIRQVFIITNKMGFKRNFSWEYRFQEGQRLEEKIWSRNQLHSNRGLIASVVF